MKKIKRFNNDSNFDYFFKKQITDKVLGKGSEGICYLGKDGLAYKRIYDDTYKYNKFCTYNADKFITKDDCDVDSYVFPDELFCVKDKVKGYKSELVHEDLLLNNFIRNGFRYKLKEHQISYSKNAIYDIILNNLKQIDYKKLKKAYEKLYEDTLIISDKGIKINDLKNNIMYDGHKLKVVDTSNYIRTKERVARRNIEILENALKDELEYLYNIISKEKVNRHEKMYRYIKNVCNNINNNYYIDNTPNNTNQKKLSLKKYT